MMPLPDPHANEPTQELDRDKVKLYQEAKAAVKAWTEEMNRRKKALIEELGNAFAGTVDGEKVVTYRPKEQYAISTLVRDYPDLTQRYFEHKVEQVFNMDKFHEQHPEIAEKYRVRAFVDL
jgi:hypothetical protein